MMSDVPECLAGSSLRSPGGCNPREMKFQRLPLVLRKFFSKTVKQRSGKDLIDDQRLALSSDLFLVKLLRVVVLAKKERQCISGSRTDLRE
jgi:hypothetical protein